MNRRLLMYLTAGSAAAAVALGTATAPALALDACAQSGRTVVSHPSDPSYGCVWGSTWMTVCDR